MQNTFNRIIKISIYLLVFLLPIFFLPFSFEIIEFNKFYLLFFLVSITALVWLAKMVFVDKEIRFKRTPLDIPILAFLFIAILSTVFSVDRFSSLVGTYGRFSDGLIGLLSFVLFYFLVTNNVTKGSNLIKVFFWSTAIVILFSYLSIFGIWAKIDTALGGVFPQIMLQRIFNPVSGSMEGLAVFLSVILVLLVELLLTQSSKITKEESRSPVLGQTIFYWILLLAILGLLLIVDFKFAWIILTVTLVLFLIFALSTRMFKENVNKLLLPIFLLVIAILFIVVDLPKTTFNSLPWEAILGQEETWGIAFKAATDNPKNIFLGSGLGTFSYDFSKFKSLDFNKTNLWQLRFDQAGNTFAEILGEIGFLGILTYLALIGLFVIVSWIFLQAKTLESKNKPQLSLLITFLALLVGQFVYYQNTVLAFIFWLVLGLSMISWQRDFGELKYSFKEFPETGLVLSTIVIILIVGVLGTYFFASRFYFADMNYANTFKTGDETIQAANLEKAIKFNPYQIQYKIILARFYLSQALSEIMKPVNEQDPTKIQEKVSKAIEQVRIATEVSPNNVAAWETRGIIYREIRGVAVGAVEWGIRSFENAIALEPANPGLHTELGKLLLGEKTEEAKAAFIKALELKPNYSDAIIQQALLAETEGNLDEAIRALDDLVKSEPFNIEALFQLGRIYYNNNRMDEAIIKFQQIILIFPNHSNAHYSLGVAYTAKGEKNLAIAEFEKVLELNPGNRDVIDKINSLKK